MSEEETTETKDQQEELSAEAMAHLEQAQMIYLAEIMQQLTESERFQRFFKINYDVTTFLDKESKTYTVRLIELPPELATTRLREMAASHAEEHMPVVQTATLEEIKKLAEEDKTNGRK